MTDQYLITKAVESLLCSHAFSFENRKTEYHDAVLVYEVCFKCGMKGPRSLRYLIEPKLLQLAKENYVGVTFKKKPLQTTLRRHIGQYPDGVYMGTLCYSDPKDIQYKTPDTIFPFAITNIDCTLCLGHMADMSFRGSNESS